MYILPQPATPPTIASSHDRPSPILHARQATATVITTALPTSNCVGQYSGGALAGAVLGTFFGTLLLIYLFSVIQANKLRGGVGVEEVVIEKRRRHKSRSGSHSSVRRPSAVYSSR